MKDKLRRAFAMLMAFMMLFSNVPVSALADYREESSQGGNYAQSAKYSGNSKQNVYVYIKVAGGETAMKSIDPRLEINQHGWITIGKTSMDLPNRNTFNVADYYDEVSPSTVNTAVGKISYKTNQAKMIKETGLIDIVKWSGNYDNVRFGLKVDNGATDYYDEAPAGGYRPNKTWHLDGYLNLDDVKAEFKLNYWDRTSNELIKTETKEASGWRQKVYPSSYLKDFTGYTYVGCDTTEPITILIGGKNTINYYYTRNTEDVSITKYWVDDNNGPQVRPDASKFSVTLNNGAGDVFTVNGSQWTQKNGNTWTATLTVPTYTDGSSAVKAEYSINETLAENSDKYVAAASNPTKYTPVDSTNKSIELTNETLYRKVTVNKKWSGDKNNMRSNNATYSGGANPGSIANPKVTLTFKHTGDKGEDKTIEVAKPASDNGGADATWTADVYLLPGTYTVEESGVYGFNFTGTTFTVADQDQTITVTNTPKTYSVAVRKEVKEKGKDSNSAFKISVGAGNTSRQVTIQYKDKNSYNHSERPENSVITYWMTCANVITGVVYGDSLSFSEDVKNGWEKSLWYRWDTNNQSDLTTTDLTSFECENAQVEKRVYGNTIVVVRNSATGAPLTVEKLWTNNESIDGSTIFVKVQAYSQNNTAVDDPIIVSVSKSATGEWKSGEVVVATEYDNKPLSYKVIGEYTDSACTKPLEGYTMSTAPASLVNGKYTLTVNNTKLASLTVSKSWAPTGSYTGDLYVKVKDNSGGNEQVLKLNANNGWTASKYVPSTGNGQQLTYKLVGEYTDESCATELTGYALSGTTTAELNNNTYSFNLKNTKQAQLTISKTVNKLDGEQYPYSFLFKVTGVAEPVEVTIGADGRGSKSITVPDTGSGIKVKETGYKYTANSNAMELADIWQSTDDVEKTAVKKGDAYSVSFTNSRVTAPLKAQKTWENTAAGATLPGIKLPVKRNGTELPNTFIMLNSSNSVSAPDGSVVWENNNGPAVPVKDVVTGAEYTYEVLSETAADGSSLGAYDFTVQTGTLTGTALKGNSAFAVTNKLARVPLTVNKSWTGDPISGDLTVTVQAVYNGKDVGSPVTVTVSNHSGTWSGTTTVPCYDSEGHLLQYRVVSESNSDGTEMADYDKNYGSTAELSENKTYTLNIYNTKLAQLTVSKSWTPGKDQTDADRPDNLYVRVQGYADETSVGAPVDLTLNANNGWTASTYVPSTSNGQQLTYKLDGEYTDESCTTALTGYVLSGTTEASLSNNEYILTPINTKQVELTISKTVNKPAAMAYPQSFSFTVTNSNTRDVQNVTLSVQSDGTYALAAGSSWPTVLVGQSYTVAETVDTSIWDVTVDGATDTEKTVTIIDGENEVSFENTRKTLGDISITKKVENYNAAYMGNDSFTIRLTLPAEMTVGAALNVTGLADTQSVTVAGGDSGKYVDFTLKHGETVTISKDQLPTGTYSVAEQNVKDEKVSGAQVEYVVTNPTAPENGTYTVTNTAQAGSLTLTKEVNDSEYTAEKTFKLTVAGKTDAQKNALRSLVTAQNGYTYENGVLTVPVTVPTTKVDGKLTASVTLDNIPAGTYTVSEPNVVGYGVTVKGSAEVTVGGTATPTVINTASGTRSITATKTWDIPSYVAANDYAAVTLQLQRKTATDPSFSDVKTALALKSEAPNQAEATWPDLPTHDDNGSLYTYRVVESYTSGDSSKYNVTVGNDVLTATGGVYARELGASDTEVTFKNSYKLAGAKLLHVSKEVVDNTVMSGSNTNRAFTVQITRGSKALSNVNCTINGTKTTLDADGKATLRNGETLVITDALALGSYTVTEVFDVDTAKVWQGTEKNQSGSVTLTADTTAAQTVALKNVRDGVTIHGAKKWDASFADTPRVTLSLYGEANGQYVTFGPDGSMTLVITKTACKTDTIDANNQSIHAYAFNGNYPKYTDAGAEITYSVEETMEENAGLYTAASGSIDTYDGTSLTNTRKTTAAKLSITKQIVPTDAVPAEAADDTFSFTIGLPGDVKAGTVIQYTKGNSETGTATADANHSIVINGIKNNDTVTLTGIVVNGTATYLPTGTYTVSESQTDGNTYTYSCGIFNGDSAVTDVTLGSSDISLTAKNTVQTGSVTVTKKWVQPNDDPATTAWTPNDPATGVSAEFVLKDGENVLETQTLNADGTVTFASVPKISSKTYTISETWHNQSAYYETVSQDTVSVRWNDNSNTFEFLDGSTVDNTKNTIVNKLKTTTVTVTKQIDWNGTAAEDIDINSPFKLRVSYTDKNTGTAYDDTYDVTYATSATGGTYTYTKGNTSTTNGIELTVPFGTVVAVSESFTGNQGDAWTPSYTPADGKVAANDATNSLVVKNTRKLVKPDGQIVVTKAWKFSDGTAIDATDNTFTANLTAVLEKDGSEFMTRAITLTDGTLKATFTNVPAADPNTGAPYAYTVKEKIGDGAAVGNSGELTVTKGTGDSGYTLTYGVTVVGYAITNTLKDGSAANARKRASVGTANLGDTVTANLGDTVTFTVSRKSHLGKASTATIEDTLPGGLDFKAGSVTITVKDASGNAVTGDTAPTTPAVDGKKLTWSGITVPAFGEVVLTYEATVNAQAIKDGNGVHTNSATVKFITDETDGKTATATVKTPVLSIDKKITNLTSTDGKYIVRTGDTVVYTITVKNSGEADAKNVVVSDPLPAGLELEGVKINGVEATGTNNQYTLASVAKNNGTATIVITATVTAKTGDIDGNVAAIAKENGKEISDLSDNTEELVISNPKLTITKSVTDNGFDADSNKSFSFTLKENGKAVTDLKTEDGKDFDGTFSLTDGDTFTISIPRGTYTLEEDIEDEVWAYTLYSGETEIQTIEIGESAVGTTTVAVTAKNTRKLYNGDGELAVTKLWHEANGSELGADFIPESITVQLYCNDAAVEGETLTLSETDGWRGSFTNLPATDANGNAYTYTVKEKVGEGAAAGDRETITASVGGIEYSYDVAIAPQANADSAIVEGYSITNTLRNKDTAPVTDKTADEDEVKIGDTITYTISHTNPYASTTTTVVTDTLPKGVVPDGKETVSVNGKALASGSYTRTLEDGILTWTVANVPPYGSVEVEFTAQVTADALVKSALTNTASVGHNDSKDTSYETSEGKTETDVVRMAIEKTLVAKNPTYRWGAMRTTYMIGEKIEYQITVTNEGSVPLKSLELEDTLTSPANKTGKTVTYTFDQPLNPGETATLTYTYTVSAQDVLPAGERHYVDNVVSATGKTEKGTELSVESEVVRAEAEHYVRVRFIDNMNGALLKEVTIPYGGSTTQPDNVNTYEGYDFEGWWGGVWKNVTSDQTIFTNYVRREGWYPARTNADGTTILDAEIPLAGGYISNVGDCFD